MSSFNSEFLSKILRSIKESTNESTVSDSSLYEIVDKALANNATKVLNNLVHDAPKLLKERLNYAAGFNERLMIRWHQPIDLLELLIEISTEIGSKFNDSFREEASKNNDFLFDVLTRQHARACQISFEILTLLKSGLADGAFGRWRSLYETVVISTLIERYRDDLPIRFLKYEIIESYKQALEYEKYCVRLGYEPLDKETILSLTKQKDDLLLLYGRYFFYEYGWVSGTILKKRNFAEIEKLVNLNHLRPYYKMSCFNVHSGPKSISFNLGLMDGDQLLLVGPSNYGLADPGQSTAISLNQMTACLLHSKAPTLEGTLFLRVLLALANEICSEFVKTQIDLENEEKVVENSGPS